MNNKNGIFAIIAAGKGSRLFNEGIEVPKPLVKIGDECLIERLIRIGKDNLFSEIICIINNQSKELKKLLTEKDWGIKIKLHIMDTESSYHSFYEIARGNNNYPLCLTTVDTVFRENEFKEFMINCRTNEDSDGVFGITSFIDDESPLYVKVNKQLLIEAFDDTINGHKFVSGGIYYFRKNLDDILKNAQKQKISRMRNFQRLLIEADYKIKGYPFEKIIDIDHATDIEKARDLLFLAY